MRDMLGSLAIAFSMYSKIPIPQMEWTDRRMKYVMCFFPLVGVVIGGIYMVCQRLLAVRNLSETAYACIGATIPLIVTGGIHMDGFLDTTDARASCQTKDRKLEILKDPHAGAFAVLGCAVYLLLYAGMFAELAVERLPALLGVHVLTRALSGLSVVWFPKAKNSGLAAAFSGLSRKTFVCCSMCLYIAAAFAWLWRIAGTTAAFTSAVVAAALFFCYRRMAVREFGGVTGDLAGYFLQMSELFLLAVLAFCG